jgi:hypothetical protein
VNDALQRRFNRPDHQNTIVFHNLGNPALIHILTVAPGAHQSSPSDYCKGRIRVITGQIGALSPLPEAARPSRTERPGGIRLAAELDSFRASSAVASEGATWIEGAVSRLRKARRDASASACQAINLRVKRRVCCWRGARTRSRASATTVAESMPNTPIPLKS